MNRMYRFIIGIYLAGNVNDPTNIDSK